MKIQPDLLQEATLEHFRKACDECHAELISWSSETQALQSMIKKVSTEMPGAESYARDLLHKTGWFLDSILFKLREDLTRHQGRLSKAPKVFISDWEDQYWLEHKEMMKKILVAYDKFRQMKKEMIYSLQYLLDRDPECQPPNQAANPVS